MFINFELAITVCHCQTNKEYNIDIFIRYQTNQMNRCSDLLLTGATRKCQWDLNPRAID